MIKIPAENYRVEQKEFRYYEMSRYPKSFNLSEFNF